VKLKGGPFDGQSAVAYGAIGTRGRRLASQFFTPVFNLANLLLHPICRALFSALTLFDAG